MTPHERAVIRRQRPLPKDRCILPPPPLDVGMAFSHADKLYEIIRSLHTIAIFLDDLPTLHK